MTQVEIKMSSQAAAVSASPPWSRSAEASRILVVAAQVALWVLVVRQFHLLEQRIFPELAGWLVGAFVVHAFLPMFLRKGFFLGLSFAAIIGAFGLWAGGAMVLIGCGFVGLGHLPIPFWSRLVLILTFVTGLALIRTEVWDPPGPQSTWLALMPIFGAIFMFRMVVYLYDLKNSPSKDGPIHRLAYFFQPPVAFFPMYPVLDYRGFAKVWYDKRPSDIYQKGIHWMFRGLTHLIFYKICYHYVVPAPSEVIGPMTFGLYVISTYLLFTRISGEFHIIIGMLALFGFNLQRSHYLYYLANSFSDVWRRINIYWRDFMTKIAFYPTYVRVKKLKPVTAVAIATCAGFVATWFFHGYQLFWLRGRFPLSIIDVSFWACLGILVLISSIVQMKQTRRKRIDPKAPWSFLRALEVSVKTSGVFLTMSVLVSYWTCTNLNQWFGMISIANSRGVFSALGLYLGLLIFPAIGIVLHFLDYQRRRLIGDYEPGFFGKAGLVTALGVILAAVSSETGLRTMPASATVFVENLLGGSFNRRDAEIMERGYYESALGTDNFTSTLWDLQQNRPSDWVPFAESEFAQPIDDPILQYTIRANVQGEKFHRQAFDTNRWGMRDRDYEQVKPEGTLRIALFGSSYSVGSGVGQADAYEPTVERWLNEERGGGAYSSYEILNFSVPGYATFQRALVAPEKIEFFKPDVVFLVYLDRDDSFTVSRLARPIARGEKLPPELDEIRKRAGVESDMDQDEMVGRLTPFVDEITLWTWRRVEEACRQDGAKPALLAILTSDSGPDWDASQRALELARKNTAFTILEIRHPFAGYDPRKLQVAPYDTHPNALGHELIADKLKILLDQNSEALGLGLGPKKTD